MKTGDITLLKIRFYTSIARVPLKFFSMPV